MPDVVQHPPPFVDGVSETVCARVVPKITKTGRALGGITETRDGAGVNLRGADVGMPESHQDIIPWFKVCRSRWRRGIPPNTQLVDADDLAAVEKVISHPLLHQNIAQ